MKKLVKAQVATEYLLLIGLIIAVIMPLFYYSFSNITQSIKMNKANELVNQIAKTSDMLYALGAGSQEKIKVDVPGGTENITISGKEINMRIKIFRGVADINAKSIANLSGNIPKEAGSRHLILKNEDNIIKIQSAS